MQLLRSFRPEDISMNNVGIGSNGPSGKPGFRLSPE